MKIAELEPYKSNTNVFSNDLANMGICVGVADETKGQVIGNRIMIMTSNHTSKS
jgi:hypothetical protein